MQMISDFTFYKINNFQTKQKLWMSLAGSLMAGMLFFMLVPMLTPLDSTFMNVIFCLAGSVLFGAGFGVISNKVLRKTSIIN